MLKSFKCIETSLSDQTQDVETLSKVCVWTNESSAGSIYLKLLSIQSIGKCVICMDSRIYLQPSGPGHPDGVQPLSVIDCILFMLWLLHM